MKRSSRNYLFGVLILTLVIVISTGCATKKETTQPDTKPAPAEVKTEEPVKSVPTPPAKTQEATPAPSAKTPEVAPPPPSPTKTTTPTPAPSPPLPKTPEPSPAPALRTTEIVLPFVNVRQAPKIDSKIVTVVKKGTKLTILEDKLGWLHIRLEDGTEGWVGKSMTAEGTKPSPAAPAKPKRP